MHSDFLDLLQLLNARRVKYLLIGGYAYSLYVEPRYTKDIDLWVEASEANARRLLKALDDFGAPVANLTEEDLATPGLLYVFGIPPLRVDILNRVKGAKFAEAYGRREKFRFENISVSVVGRDDLIRLKKAADRPQDRADLKKLALIADLTSTKPRNAKKAGARKRKR